MAFITDNGLAFLPPDDENILPEDADLTDDTEEDGPAFYGREYAFDFVLGEFITNDDDEITYVEGPDAVLQSLKKALATPANFFLAYPPDYGNETADALADPDAPVGATTADLALSFCADTIEADPRVSSVDGLDVEVDEGAETVTVTGVIADSFGAVFDLDFTFSYTAHLP